MVSLSPYPASCPLTYLQPRIRKNEDDFHWAVQTASEKKKLDCSAAEFLTVDEGLCVQMMHHGSYDNEPATIAAMDAIWYTTAIKTIWAAADCTMKSICLIPENAFPKNGKP